MMLGFVAGMLVTMPAVAQRINFSTFASDDILITQGSVQELDFNQKQAVILGGSNVNILLTDPSAVVFAIEANAEFDITIEITADPWLELLVGQSIYKIPFTPGFSYTNNGSLTEAQAKLQAVPVASGFSGITIPVFHRTGAAPTPPPTPVHAGYVAPKSTVYLFLYGSIAVPLNSPVGLYSGNINIHVFYTTNIQ